MLGAASLRGAGDGRAGSRARGNAASHTHFGAARITVSGSRLAVLREDGATAPSCLSGVRGQPPTHPPGVVEPLLDWGRGCGGTEGIVAAGGRWLRSAAMLKGTLRRWGDICASEPLAS